MGKKKLKHLGKKRKKLLMTNFKKSVVVIWVVISVIAMYNITNDVKNKQEAKKTILEEFKIEFINQVKKGSKENYRKYNIYPSITIAQAILESGWGQSQLTKDANNLFGIKADSSWDGEYVEVMTDENYNDKVNAKFRKYKDINASINDHGKFLVENKRYEENGVFEAKDYKEQAKALQNAGYSTKKNKKGELIYADMLINIIETNGLHLLDSKF